MGKPGKNPRHDYMKIAVEQVIIWQPPDIEADQLDGLIEITLTKFLFFKSLSVKGARAKKT
ncbi:MAG: hypothetical protein AB1545_13595 [Thermodesulfobacteriota bacterium]|jgi:hypothetical protein